MKLILVFSILFLPLVVGAHGAGPYFETVSGEYIADIGYSVQAPSVGEAVLFDFQLRNLESPIISGSDAVFSDVWVKVESEEGVVVLATGVHNAEFGGPRLSYMFPSEGVYTISARYENGMESLAEASFPLTVVPASAGSLFGSFKLEGAYGFGAMGFLIGCLVTFLLIRRRRM